MTQETNDSRSEVLSQEPSASDRQKLERKIVVQLEYLKTKLMEVLTALDGITAKDKQEETISRIPSGRRSAAGVFMRTKATLQSLEALGGFIKKFAPYIYPLMKHERRLFNFTACTEQYFHDIGMVWSPETPTDGHKQKLAADRCHHFQLVDCVLGVLLSGPGQSDWIS